MENPLEDLSTSALRNLLIEEIKKFIICLDNGSTDQLDGMKIHLRMIYDKITEREIKEATSLVWGKNSTEARKLDSQLDFLKDIIS